jgi:hypothetical protein
MNIVKGTKIEIDLNNFYVCWEGSGIVNLKRLDINSGMWINDKQIDVLVQLLKTLQQEIDQCEDRP